MDQHCLSCGRDTAAGSDLFASRKRGIDRQTSVEGYLCYPCKPRTASGGAEQSIPPAGRYAVVDIGGIPQG
jgi:hypothetical protein